MLVDVAFNCLQRPLFPPSLQMKLVLCASLETGCLVAAITANLERFARLYVGEKRVIILQVDEIATEPRARYYAVVDEMRFAF